MEVKEITERLKLLIKPLVMVALVITAMYFFGLYALGGVILFSWWSTWRKKHLSVLAKLARSFLIVFKVVTFFLILRWLGAWGALGYLVSIAFLSAYKIWIHNDIFMDGVKEIETMVWGTTANERNKRRKKRKSKSN